jgi:hypothetical protein
MSSPERGAVRTIDVTRRAADWHACDGENKAIWGCGSTIDAAIGDVVRSHREHFEIAITFDGKLAGWRAPKEDDTEITDEAATQQGGVTA